MTNTTVTKPSSENARLPLGALHPHGNDRYTLTFVRDFPHPISTVWAAITDPALTVRWWAEARVDLQPGGQFDLRWLNSEEGGPQDWTTGAVVQIDPPRMIEHTNSRHGLLRWELSETSPTSTQLTFTNEVTGDARGVSRSLGGWHIHLDHLVASFDGETTDWPRWHLDHLAAWQALVDAYVQEYDLPVE